MKRNNGDIFLEDVESRNGQPDSEITESGPSLIDEILEIATEHRRALIRIGLIALVVSTAVAFLIPKRYESTTRIMPPEGPNPLHSRGGDRENACSPRRACRRSTRCQEHRAL